MRKYMNSTLFRQARFRMPVQKLLDADDGSTGSEVGGSAGGVEEGSSSDGSNDAETIDDLKAKLKKAETDAQRYKISLDKTMKEKSELSKKNRDMMSAEQLAKEAEEEREKRFAEMEKELRVSRYSKRLVGIGMPEAEADTFAGIIPALDDADAFFSTLDTFIKAKEKAASDKAIQDLLKQRPDINAGNGESDKDDPAMALAKKAVEESKRGLAMSSQDVIKNFL